MEKKYWFLLDLFVGLFIVYLCWIFFFQGLGDFSVRMWDEGRNGVNAIEMFKSKNFLVTTYNGSPDNWNTKPPMLIWLITLFYWVFGISEFALRAPSAIAASLTTILLYIFSLKILKSRSIGILSVLVLLSSFGFSDIHAGRTGDYDALLTFFVTAAVFTLFIFLQKKNPKVLYTSVFFWICAALTKGIAALLITPGIVLYIILTGNLFTLLKSKHTWIGIVIFITSISLYYLGRNIVSPGYIDSVWFEELWGRATIQNQTDENQLFYYWKWMKDFRFQHWLYFVPISFLPYFFIEKKNILKNWTLFSYLAVIGFLIVISTAKSKNIWYDVQVYPLMSLLVSILIITFIKKLPLIVRIIPIVILLFYTQRYVRTNFAYIHRPDLEKSNNCYKYGYLFRTNTIDKKNLIGVHINEEYCMPFTFYMKKENIPTKKIAQLRIKDKFLTCDGDTVNMITPLYKTKTVFDNKDGCVVLQIEE
jgi:4-amino-4-deoxy-L-arabinose transferase-like glycosyltransferase